MTRRAPLRASAIAAAALASLAALLALGCGKKAPPLPPLVGSKPRITTLELRQEGSTVRARFEMPVRAGAEIIDYRTRGLELWRRVAEPAPAGASGTGAATPAPAPAPAPRPPASPGGANEPSLGLPVGEFTKSAQLVQSITGDDLFELLASPEPELVDAGPEELWGQELEYAIVLKSDIKSSGTVSDLVRITPRQPPAPPQGVSVAATETSLRLTWTPAQDAEGRPLPVDVYRADPDRPYGAAPVNERPLAAPPFDDPATAAGQTRRYVLRSVVASATPPLRSDASDEVALAWKDEFPPATPEGLRSFLDGAVVTLLWTPNDERDLAGYFAWRRAPGSDWTKLNETPLPSATFTDPNPPPGARAEYAVSAVDRATPPNESARSKGVTEEIPPR